MDTVMKKVLKTVVENQGKHIITKYYENNLKLL